ncbi:hypothetical protein PIB30_090418 [Stylosanthes scabra]|uniref:Uncharacterized protein n=1 Tax=Stylosanthes scabra TaxID=79078 RepID=A0ABU6TWM1_9FABA|nr:hypothetical protein [Stylosanthes scabra]
MGTTERRRWGRELRVAGDGVAIGTPVSLALTFYKTNENEEGNDGESYGQESLEGASLMLKKNLEEWMMVYSAKMRRMEELVLVISSMIMMKRMIREED